MGVDPDAGLTVAEVDRRLGEYGPNELPKEPPPSIWVVARGQLVNPMNIMLLLVVGASFAIVQIATALVVLGLVLFNVVMGTNQELKARASVDALAKLQVPHARVRRSGQIEQIDSTGLVPGDIVLLEAGDVVPADGRIISSATLEVQEAALTGESAPVPKDAGTLPEGEVALGDRTNLVFQNTQVTRGTATVVVTGRSAAEHLIAALRCLYEHAEEDALIDPAGNPARKVDKPRRLPSTRRAVADNRLAEINETTATTGDDPELDTLLLRLHTEKPAAAAARWRCARATSIPSSA